jgi:hypothetical protein
MSIATAVAAAFRQIASDAEGTPYATQALADAEHVAALIPKAVEDVADETAEAEVSVLSWLTKRLHPEAAAPAVPPTKPAPEPAPVTPTAPVTGAGS